MKFVENIERLELFQMKPEDRHAIFEAWLDKQLDIFWDGSWRTENLDITTLVRSHIYRTKTVPDSINWDQVRSDLNFMFRDDDGNAWLSADKPTKLSGRRLEDTMPISALGFASYRQGNKPWDQSLVIRPGYQPEAVQ